MVWEYLKNSPVQALLILIFIYLGWKFGIWLMRNLYHKSQTKHRIYLRVTLPREDSSKDKEKETEKDFREKISVMAQFYRNLHETMELNIMNRIKVWLLQHNIFSFELVAHEKVIDFYITTHKFYKEIIEKQIVSYYPSADIEPMEDYIVVPEGNAVKGYYAYLERDYWFPIKTFKVVENDPLNDMSNVFTKTDKDETAIIQIVIRPKKGKWAKKAEKFGEAYFKGKQGASKKIPGLSSILNIFKAIFLGVDKLEIESSQGGDGYVRMLQSKEDVAKRIGQKSSQNGFDTVVRLIGSAKTEDRAREITNNMIVGLNLFKDPSANWFQTNRVLLMDNANDRLILHNFKHRLIDTRILGIGEKKSIMVEEELASLWHLPASKYNQSPIIRWLDYKVLPAPTNLPEEGIILGNNVYRGQKREVRFQRKDRSRHHYIIGKSGSGKSALLSYMARQDIWNGEGVCVIDPHGDLVEDILSYVPKERAKDVIIFDPADTTRPMGLNMLEANTTAEMDLISSQATEIFIKLFGDEIFGPRIQHYFRNACLTLMEDQDEGATLIDVPRIFTDDAFLKYKVKKVRNPVVKSFWQNEYANTGDRERQEMIPYFSSKFGPFITNSIMRNTIGQKKSSFNFRQVMDEGKILFVKLSKGSIGDLNTQLLGLVIVARIQMAAMSRADIPESTRKDFFLYVDEFQNFATDSFSSILSEARKYHLNLIMAHQYINQLVVSKFGNTSTQIRDAVFGNVGTMCSFKVGADDAEYLSKEYAPILTEQDVLGISNYKMYTKLNINNTTSRPFSISTIWDETGQNEKVAKIIKEYSRLKHARKVEFVEQEITNRIGINMNAPAVDIDKLPGQPAGGGGEAAPAGGLGAILAAAAGNQNAAEPVALPVKEDGAALPPPPPINPSE